MGFQPFPVFGRGLGRRFGSGGGSDDYFASIMSLSPLLFLDADLGLLFTDAGGTIPAVNNNDNVSLWKDRSNSLFNMAVGTAAKLQTAVAAYKSKKTVLFTAASSQYLIRSMAGICANRNIYNIIAVFNSTSGGIRTIYSETDSVSNTPLLVIRSGASVAGDVNFQHRDNSGTIVTIISSGGLVNNSSPHMATFRRISSASFDCRVDGASVGTSTNNPTTTTLNSVSVGARYVTGALTQFMDGQIAALIITPNDNYAKVEPILAGRFGVALP